MKTAHLSVLALGVGLLMAGCSAGSTTTVPPTLGTQVHLRPQSLCTNPSQCPPIVKPLDHLYATDSLNRGFDVFEQGTTVQSDFEYAVKTSSLPSPSWPTSLAINPANGDVFASMYLTADIYSQDAFDTQSNGATVNTWPKASLNAASFGTGGAISGIAFDGAGHVMVAGYTSTPSFRIYTYALSQMTGLGSSPSPVGKLGVSANRVVARPFAIAADTATHTVYVVDQINGQIGEFSTLGAPLDDAMSPKCWITPPSRPNEGNKAVSIAFNSYNHLLYAVMYNGEVEAFASCSSTPSRDITNIVPANLATDPTNTGNRIAADPQTGNISIFWNRAFGFSGLPNSLVTFGPADNGTVTPVTISMSDVWGATGVAYGP